ncbi:hypothetical protein CBL_01798 [Carabus blaptoides fortunei]
MRQPVLGVVEQLAWIYKLWKFQVDAILRGKELSKYVRDTVAIDATLAQVDAFSIEDGKPMHILISSLKSDEAQNVLTCLTAKEIFDKLGSIYAKRSEVSVMTLYEEYFALKMVEDDSVTTYVSKVMKLAAEIEDQGEKFSYNIKEGCDLNNLLSRLRQEEDQLNKNIDADSAAFIIRSPSRRRLQNITTVAEQGIGASHHKSKEWFSELKENLTERYIRVASNERLTIRGQGLIRMSMWNGTNWKECTLENVQYVPGLGPNPFSAATVTSRGFFMVEKVRDCELRYPDGTIAKVDVKDSLNHYKLVFRHEVKKGNGEQRNKNMYTPEVIFEAPEREERYNLRPFIYGPDSGGAESNSGFCINALSVKPVLNSGSPNGGILSGAVLEIDFNACLSSESVNEWVPQFVSVISPVSKLMISLQDGGARESRNSFEGLRVYRLGDRDPTGIYSYSGI